MTSVVVLYMPAFLGELIKYMSSLLHTEGHAHPFDNGDQSFMEFNDLTQTKILKSSFGEETMPQSDMTIAS